VHGDDGHAERLGDDPLALLGDPARSCCRIARQAITAEALPSGGYLAISRSKRRAGVLGQQRVRGQRRVHRSISPKTMSIVPMIATASAIMCPRASSSSAARCGKPGARIFSRYGLLAPSLTM
jgi:hypothetical protein